MERERGISVSRPVAQSLTQLARSVFLSLGRSVARSGDHIVIPVKKNYRLCPIIALPFRFPGFPFLFTFVFFVSFVFCFFCFLKKNSLVFDGGMKEGFGR